MNIVIMYMYILSISHSLSLQLTNEQFEDLAADVYDEVDRRECDSSKY